MSKLVPARPAVFLDRDGVINEVVFRQGEPASPRSLEEFVLVPDIQVAVDRLKQANFLVFVVTNQPDISRQKMSAIALEQMSHRIRQQLAVDAIAVCPHDNQHNCDCRKPRPGMLLSLAAEWHVDLRRSVIVGDSWKDMVAGQAAGCYRILLDRPYNQGTSANQVVPDVLSAVEFILNQFPKEDLEMGYTADFLADAKTIIDSIDIGILEKMVDELVTIRENGGRLFFIGVGGGAGHASHAVNDFRKIAGIESYTPTDNVSELTARINDDGWETAFVNWLKGSRLNAKDGLFVFSVGGGNAEKNVSVNIVSSLQYAKELGAKVFGVVGRDGGYTASVADACVVIPPLRKESVTPQTEAFQAVVWHLVVSHPKLQQYEMKWESVDKP